MLSLILLYYQGYILQLNIIMETGKILFVNHEIKSSFIFNNDKKYI